MYSKSNVRVAMLDYGGCFTPSYSALKRYRTMLSGGPQCINDCVSKTPFRCGAADLAFGTEIPFALTLVGANAGHNGSLVRPSHGPECRSCYRQRVLHRVGRARPHTLMHNPMLEGQRDSVHGVNAIAVIQASLNYRMFVQSPSRFGNTSPDELLVSWCQFYSSTMSEASSSY